jgi:hypothetical protein
MADEQRQMLDVYLQEYGKLKDEQAQRIGFRENLLYVTLALISYTSRYYSYRISSPFMSKFPGCDYEQQFFS